MSTACRLYSQLRTYRCVAANHRDGPLPDSCTAMITPRQADYFAMLRERRRMRGSLTYTAACLDVTAPMRRSHWRRDAAADVDAGRRQGSVRLFRRRGDEDIGPGFELALFTQHVDDDRCILRHHDLLLAILVLEHQDMAVVRCGGLLDIAVGHSARRLQVPAAVSVAGAAHRLGEDVH